MKMFKNEDYGTQTVYKYFLQNGGFRAFPDAVIVRLDWEDVRCIDVVDGTFTCTTEIMMNAVNTHNEKKDSHLYDFQAKIKNCSSDEGAEIFMVKKEQGVDGFEQKENNFKKKLYLMKEVQDEERGDR